MSAASTFRARLNLLREDIIKTIQNYVDYAEGFLYISDINSNASIVVMPGYFDDNETFTLDRIYEDNNGLHFDASSAVANAVLSTDTVGLDGLINIVDFLEENQSTILEYYKYYPRVQ